MNIWLKAKNFIHEDIWRFRREQLSSKLFSLLVVVRVFVLSIRKFESDSCRDKASALTYYSVLSIVPLAAMAFGLAKAFGFESVLSDFLISSFEGHEVVATYVLDFAESYIANIKGGLVAGIGLGMLVWSSMNLIGHTEEAFNNIWSVKNSRSFVRKLSDYISIIIISVIAIAACSSLMVNASSFLVDSYLLSKVWSAALAVAPCILVWIGLSLIYYILPNTKVSIVSALVGGLAAGVVIMSVQFFYLYFQIGMSKNNAIYGSFAAIPLFLIWMQLTWHIVMWGAELSFAVQNVRSFEFDSDTSRYSLSLKRKISVFICSHIAKCFRDCQPALTASQISVDLKLPLQIVKSLINEMLDAKLLTEVRADANADFGYQPAFDINALTVSKFVNMIENKGDVVCSVDNGSFEAISALFDDTYGKCNGDVFIKDL